MAHQVFISYASEDSAAAQAVCGALENSGIRCWIAPRDIAAGTNYPAAIVDAVESATALVLILTKDAGASRNVQSEVEQAFQAGKGLLPFRLNAAAMPASLDYFLSPTQWLDAPEGCTPANLKRLVDATAQVLAGGQIRRADPLPPWWRTWKIAAAGAALITMGGLAYIKWPRPAIPPAPIPAPSQPSLSASVKATPKQPDASPQPLPPKTRINPKDGQTYVWIPPGEFVFGCSDGDIHCEKNEPSQQEVRIAKGFWIGRTEVPAASYVAYAKKRGLDLRTTDANLLPMTGVTWKQAQDYCIAGGGRLPKESEWEYAARGGVDRAAYGSLPKIAWYEANSDGSPHPVGQKAANDFGLYDMLGNVAEWVLDMHPESREQLARYPNARAFMAVARGGSWGDAAAKVRVSRREIAEIDGSYDSVGFRCASDER